MKPVYGMSALSKLLSQERRKLGLTQAEFGEKLGAPQSYVARFESGTHDVRLSRFLEMVRVLGLDIVIVPKETASQLQSYYYNPSASNAEQPAYRPMVGDLDDDDDES